MRLANKNCIVTGGASGIGEAIVRRFAAEGANILIADINDDDGTKLAEELGASVSFEACNVSQEQSVDRLAEVAFKKFSRIDVLVNNAATELNLPYKETSSEQWDKVIQTNFKGPWMLCKSIVPHMEKHSSGSVVNVASVTGVVGYPMSTAYGGSKGGVVMFTKHMAAELASSGVRFNCVCPGVIQTPMIERWIDDMPIRQEAVDMLTASMPIGRIGQPDEVASAVLFFASDDSTLCQGSVLRVDGGFK